MAAELLYNVVAPTGKYTASDGTEKTSWVKCGVVMKTPNGNITIKLEALPVAPTPAVDGKPGLWLQCFKPQPRNGNNQQQGQQQVQQGQQQGQKHAFRRSERTQNTDPFGGAMPGGSGMPQQGFDPDDDIPF